MEGVAKQARSRSPNFPVLTLAQAIHVADFIYDNDGQSPATAPVIAAHLSSKPSSSAFYQTLAALKRYGLLEEVPKSARIAAGRFISNVTPTDALAIDRPTDRDHTGQIYRFSPSLITPASGVNPFESPEKSAQIAHGPGLAGEIDRPLREPATPDGQTSPSSSITTHADTFEVGRRKGINESSGGSSGESSIGSSVRKQGHRRFDDVTISGSPAGSGRWRLTRHAIELLGLLPGTPHFAAAAQRASTRPLEFAMLHQQFAPDWPSDRNLIDHLITTRGFTPESATKAIAIVRSNLRLATSNETGVDELSRAKKFGEHRATRPAVKDFDNPAVEGSLSKTPDTSQNSGPIDGQKVIDSSPPTPLVDPGLPQSITPAPPTMSPLIDDPKRPPGKATADQRTSGEPVNRVIDTHATTFDFPIYLTSGARGSISIPKAAGASDIELIRRQLERHLEAVLDLTKGGQ